MTVVDVRQAIIDRVERYFDSWRTGDIAARRRLFSPHGVLEDPVGSAPIEGSAALEAHWTRIASDGASFEPQLRRVIVADHEALVLALVKILPTHGPSEILEVHATVEFDRALEIRRLRFFQDDTCTHVGS